MLIKAKPSTAHCNKEIYTSYLLSDPQYTSYTCLAEIMETISHDSINRFLERERFEPEDLFHEEKNKIELVGGINFPGPSRELGTLIFQCLLFSGIITIVVVYTLNRPNMIRSFSVML